MADHTGHLLDGRLAEIKCAYGDEAGAITVRDGIVP